MMTFRSSKIKQALIMAMMLSAVAYAQDNDISHTTGEKTASYQVVDTGQVKFFSNDTEISQPQKGDAFYGQDAQFIKNKASYTDNDDGTITDNVTGLMWQKSYKVLTYEEAVAAVKTLNLAGRSDWRLPTIKELYSLMDFSGADPSGAGSNGEPPNGVPGISTDGAIPFIDTDYFDFEFGSNGEREVDTQLLSSTRYQGKTMKTNDTVFGLNVADGRIKGYELIDPRIQSGKLFTVRFVRGNSDYGKNDFVEQNGTVADKSTGLMWSKDDSKKGMNWQEALAYAEQKNKENYLGYSDWRLPDAKELQSIVDYNRSPQATHSAAIDPIFNISTIADEGGKTNYPFFWTSTTHKNVKRVSWAVYISFGEGLGYFAPPHASQDKELMDVHGAGSQRSDPKTGSAGDYPQGNGPQGDVVRVNNYVRLVRDMN